MLFNNAKLLKFVVVYIICYKIFDFIIVPTLCDLFQTHRRDLLNRNKLKNNFYFYKL